MTGPADGSPLRDLLEAAGARFHRDAGVERPRHFGDPAGEYRSAVEGAAVLDRSERVRLRVAGRAPGRMLQGVLTQRVPGPERPEAPGVLRGRALYSAVLTPKGRMVSDLRVFRIDAAEDVGDGGDGGEGTPPAGIGLTKGPATVPGRDEGGEELLLDVPAEGAEGLRDHLGRFIPPRFATVEDVSAATGLLTVMGPDAAGLLSLHALGLRVDEGALAGLEEGEYRAVDTGAGQRIRVVASGDVATPAFDLLADLATLRALWGTLRDAGATAVGHGTWETLRVEAGRPAFGRDMDDGTLPLEAGIGPRAIDHGKGCYTGQEVVIRIRDRGHVNRELRRIRLSEGPAPAPGTELFAPDVRGEKVAGTITTVAESPRLGGTVALAYVRREVEVPGEVRVGTPEGRVATVEAVE